MEPIISPWLIYLAGIVNPLKFALGLIAFIGFIVCFVIGCIYYIEGPCYGFGEESIRKAERKQAVALKLMKVIAPITLVSFLVQVFIPDKDTLIAITIANIVTVDNIQGANEFVKTNVHDYIDMLTDAINKVK